MMKMIIILMIMMMKITKKNDRYHVFLVKIFKLIQILKFESIFTFAFSCVFMHKHFQTCIHFKSNHIRNRF